MNFPLTIRLSLLIFISKSIRSSYSVLSSNFKIRPRSLFYPRYINFKMISDNTISSTSNEKSMDRKHKGGSSLKMNKGGKFVNDSREDAKKSSKVVLPDNETTRASLPKPPKENRRPQKISSANDIIVPPTPPAESGRIVSVTASLEKSTSIEKNDVPQKAPEKSKRPRNRNKRARAPTDEKIQGEDNISIDARPTPSVAPAQSNILSKNDSRKKPSTATAAANRSSTATAKPAKLEEESDTDSVVISRKSDSDKALVHMTDQEFQNLRISELTRRALADVLKYRYMTQVQVSTLPVILQGNDCLAKAKTGTGKTLAFLIPAIERLRGATNGKIPILVLSPNRELAAQIATEANELLTFHPNRKVECIVGGTNMNTDKRNLNDANIAILVATPGRLQDHLDNTQGFVDKLSKLQVLILDEADQLLDMGFKPALDRILSFLPPASTRQTLLFSATVAPAVEQIANAFLRKGFTFVDTVGEEKEQTHEHVPQQLVTVGMNEILPAVLSILSMQMKEPGFKILVFFTTARVAGYMADVFTTALRFPVLQIHSRMSQGARTKTSELFRSKSNVVMFSSDVSARGMDYPDVTFVLQVGSTEKAQYIHRLGRTARAGKEGAGMLLLQDFEERSMVRELKDMPLQRVDAKALNMAAFLPTTSNALASVSRNSELAKSADQAYQAWLGYYNGKLRALGWTKEQLVSQANAYAKTLGLSEVPALQKKTIGKMGLKGVPGLRIAPFDHGK